MEILTSWSTGTLATSLRHGYLYSTVFLFPDSPVQKPQASNFGSVHQSEALGLML